MSGEIFYTSKGGVGGGTVQAWARGARLDGGDLEVGLLNWGSDNKVHHLGVHHEYHGRGIGQHLWMRGYRLTVGQLAHSADRSDAGEGFARKVGGNTPARSSYRGK